VKSITFTPNHAYANLLITYIYRIVLGNGMSFEISFSSHDSEHVLLCPYCKGTYLRHNKVEIYERQEDAIIGNHIVVESDATTIDEIMIGNPSARLNGMKIYFSCEGCSNEPVLSISQHKGETLLSFQ